MNAQIITISSEVYAQVDVELQLVTFHQGRKLGDDLDWGGKLLFVLDLAQFHKLAELVPGPENDVDFYHDERGKLEDEPGYTESRYPWMY